MKYVSWNVNGIRSVLKKGFLDFWQEYQPDFLCLQEVRAEQSAVSLPTDGYHVYWAVADKKGYSGVAIFSKEKPLDVAYGMGMPQHDAEGRMITLEFEDRYLVTVYTPNAQRDLARLPYRVYEWDKAFLEYVRQLEERKPVIFCGDLNVAHKEIDLARPKSNRGNAGFTDEERASFDRIVEAGFIDTFREFNQEGGQYSWWSYMANARKKNVGWRIDYFCISLSLRPRLKGADILAHVGGSDHCPVTMELE